MKPAASARILPVGPARKVACLVVVLTLLAIAAVTVSGLTLLIRILLVAVALAYGWRVAHCLLWPTLRGISLTAEGVRIIQHSGGDQPTVRVAACFVCPWFVSFGSGLSGFGLFREQLADDDFRRLSVFLRHGGWH